MHSPSRFTSIALCKFYRSRHRLSRNHVGRRLSITLFSYFRCSTIPLDGFCYGAIYAEATKDVPSHAFTLPYSATAFYRRVLPLVYRLRERNVHISASQTTTEAD